MAIRSLSASVSELASTFAGELLQPQDPGYDLARRVHNGLIDRRPALIARCGGTADIVDAVKLAQEHGLEVAVRGGGHNVAGRCTTDNGLMIDLAAMTGIRVDQQSRTAHAQGGVTWGLFNRETQLHGLATTGGVISTTGIAGLSLGGGVGWHTHDDRLLRGMPKPNGGTPARALPRSCNPHRGRGHGVSTADGRLQPAGIVAVDGAEGQRSLHRVGKAVLRGDAAIHGLGALRELYGRG
jgi:hypothetical protein